VDPVCAEADWLLPDRFAGHVGALDDVEQPRIIIRQKRVE